MPCTPLIAWWCPRTDIVLSTMWRAMVRCDSWVPCPGWQLSCRNPAIVVSCVSTLPSLIRHTIVVGLCSLSQVCFVFLLASGLVLSSLCLFFSSLLAPCPYGVVSFCFGFLPRFWFAFVLSSVPFALLRFLASAWSSACCPCVRFFPCALFPSVVGVYFSLKLK
jgi:hypothetical protein